MAGHPPSQLPPLRSVQVVEQSRACGALTRKINEAHGRPVLESSPAVTNCGTDRSDSVANDVQDGDEPIRHDDSLPPVAASCSSANEGRKSLGDLANALQQSTCNESRGQPATEEWVPTAPTDKPRAQALSGASMAARLVAGMRPKKAD